MFFDLVVVVGGQQLTLLRRKHTQTERQLLVMYHCHHIIHIPRFFNAQPFLVRRYQLLLLLIEFSSVRLQWPENLKAYCLHSAGTLQDGRQLHIGVHANFF